MTIMQKCPECQGLETPDAECSSCLGYGYVAHKPPWGWHSLLAECRTCGERFVPADRYDLMHLEREDGTECGGPGEVIAEFYA